MKDLIDSLESQLLDVKQKFAEQVCPLKIGDIVTLNYTHKGKKAIVTNIKYKMGYKPKHGWIVFAKVLKNDGTESKLIADFYREDHFQLESN